MSIVIYSSHILFYKAYVDRVTGSDFIYMNTSLYGNGTSFVESLFEEFGTFIQLTVMSCFLHML